MNNHGTPVAAVENYKRQAHLENEMAVSLQPRIIALTLHGVSDPEFAIRFRSAQVRRGQ